MKFKKIITQTKSIINTYYSISGLISRTLQENLTTHDNEI